MNIAHNRRHYPRYGIKLELSWRLTSRKKVGVQGTGRTLNVSSGGLHFESSQPLPVGERLALSVDWPAMLHNVTPLQLVLDGVIVRSTAGHVSVRMVRYEFHTRRIGRSGV
jgi:hypothetical protein